MKKYTSPPLSTQEIIHLLEQRGLIIQDFSVAKDFLTHVSYFRFANYLRPFEKEPQQHLYKPNTSFEEVQSLYYFDEQLRHLLFGVIQKIEISLRSQIINTFSLKYGSLWFMDASLTLDRHKFISNLNVIEKELLLSKDDFIQSHYTKYGSRSYPPAWKVIELTTFGNLIKLYANFSDTSVKKDIAHTYHLPHHKVLESWNSSVNLLRNICAHHGRVWNRVLTATPQIPHTLSDKWIHSFTLSNRLYTILCCMIYWINVIDVRNHFVRDLQVLFTTYPNVDIKAMGFPTDWQSEPLWSI